MRHLFEFGVTRPEVIAQRAGEGIAMRAELAAGRQHGEHRAVHARDRIQELDRLRAQRARRRQKVVVPFQVKPLPAALEERVKAPVVVLRGGADKALVEQPHRLVADRLPILAELGSVRESARPGSPACSEPPSPHTSTRCRARGRSSDRRAGARSEAARGRGSAHRSSMRRGCREQRVVARKAVLAFSGSCTRDARI